MDPTLQSLLLQPELSLSLLHPGESLDAEINWVANSDLSDPRPFLSAGQVLLTTGRQFSDWTNQQSFDDYVTNLASWGILGIGFGTEIFEAGTPLELVAACRRAGMSLVEVPYGTPFIAIIQWISDTSAHKSKARADWAARAQGAVSLAAIKGNGVDGVLQELAHQLSARVSIFDGHGRATKLFGSPALGDELEKALAAEAQRLLLNRKRAGSSLNVEGTESVFQTLGEQRTMFGVLTITGGDRFDRAAISVITTAVALGEISFQDEAARAGERMIAQTGVLTMLLEGHSDAAMMFPSLGDSRLPRGGKIGLAVIGDGAENCVGLEHELKNHPAVGRIERLVARYNDDAVIVFANAHRRHIANALDNMGVRAGLSGPVSPEKARQGLEQAIMALSSSQAGINVADWGDSTTKGFWELLGREELRDYSALRLAALKDRPDGDELISFARAWFAHNCNGDAAAKDVGLHRHVLRNRLELIESTLGLTLGTFEGRAELWALLSTES
ncbi:MAG: PucR family transcriptional regulator [Actinomycetales bacterium]|nr:PucR family transcriptional regulator [Actinomycetales bacterium]